MASRLPLAGTADDSGSFGYTESLRRRDLAPPFASLTRFRQPAMPTNPNEAPRRREVHFSGRVQGVGFRYITRQIASRYDLTGYVQNLADGRVRLVAEGPPSVVEAFVTAVIDEMGRCIEKAEQQDTDASGEFSKFEVKY
jgi:acylphosphatase